MTRTTTTVREYDEQGRVVKETTTVVEAQDASPPLLPLPPCTPTYPTWPMPGPVWCTTDTKAIAHVNGAL